MTPSPKKDYYNLLGLPPDARPKQIRDAYRRCVTACHPDKFQDPVQKLRAEEAVKQLNQAYETLRDASQRAAYDRCHTPRPVSSPRPARQPQRSGTTSFYRPARQPAYQHTYTPEAPSVTPLDAVYPAFSADSSPAANHLHYVFSAAQGDQVEIFLEHRANVILLDELNYSRCRAGADFNYLGGFARSSPAVLQIPISDRWHLIVDTAGGPGIVRAAVRLVTSSW